MAEVRKLAAILAPDVVGFSRLTGADGERTLARLRALRSDLIDPTVAGHKGSELAMVRWSSSEALRSAIEVQSAMVERNAGLPPERRIEFRVGIHLSDVVEESDGDLMGDGVNIAARLEGVATAGTICQSEDAYRPVRARLDLVVSDLGETKLTNIIEPIRVYSLHVGVKPQEATSIAQVTVSAPQITSGTMTLSDKPSIAVPPFTTMSGDAEQEYFVGGIVEDHHGSLPF
jgi:adenylate cyclase